MSKYILNSGYLLIISCEDSDFAKKFNQHLISVMKLSDGIWVARVLDRKNRDNIINLLKTAGTTFSIIFINNTSGSKIECSDTNLKNIAMPIVNPEWEL